MGVLNLIDDALGVFAIKISSQLLLACVRGNLLWRCIAGRMSESHNDIGNTNPAQWIAECEPRISSMPRFNLAALIKANPPPLPNENSAYQYNLTILPPDNIAYPYHPAVPTQVNSPLPPQETSGYSYDLAVLVRENLPSLLYKNSAYDYAVPAQVNSSPPPQEITGYSYDLAVLATGNLPSLLYKNLAYLYDPVVTAQANSLPP